MRKLGWDKAEGVVLIALAVTVVIGREAWRASHRGGFPLISFQTAEALRPILLISLVVGALALLAWFGRDKGNDS